MDELERLAREATGGPDFKATGVSSHFNAPWWICCTFKAEEDARFTAACKRDVILKVIGRVRELEAMWQEEHAERIRLEVQLNSAEAATKNWREIALEHGDEE